MSKEQIQAVGRIGRRDNMCAKCRSFPVAHFGDVCPICRDKGKRLFVRVVVRASDLKEDDPVQRALGRSLIEQGLSALEYVHVGQTEIGFVLDGEQWEARLGPKDSDWIYQVAFQENLSTPDRLFVFKKD